MAAISESLTQRLQSTVDRRFNWGFWFQDNFRASWLLTAWVIVLTLATLGLTIRQMGQYPMATTITLVVWLIGIVLAGLEGLHIRYSRLGRWLKTNLLSSVSNALLTLLLVLALIALVDSILQWAVVNATFDPELTEPQYRNPDGATWGVIVGAWDLLMVGRFPREEMSRVTGVVGFFAVMAVVTFAANKTGLWDRVKPVGQILTALWVLSPVVVYILLAGVPIVEDQLLNPVTLIVGEILVLGTFALLWWQRVIRFSWPTLIGWAVAWPVFYVAWRLLGQSELFPPIDPTLWGGLLLTLIIASAVILLSFPLGMVLALGRRSEIRGIPWWLIWPVAIVATIWGLMNSTPSILEQADALWQQVVAFWPLLILVAAFILQRLFQGNVIAATSTAFIEIMRGVPLITLLFMAIIMARFFLPVGAEIENVVAVILFYALFSAAYMAELIRGGLQAIPRGQYDAADAIGLNSLQKMRFIILPQAITLVIPGIVGQFIGSYKSSSLVLLVGLFELLGITGPITSNPQWLGLRQELYVFVGVIYFTGSFIMSWYSRRLERRLRVGQN
jgi:general L-amino acid transport system permease protein